MRYFRITTVVWGTEFIELFVKATLPSLLAPGNLPSMRDGIPLKYRIYTTPQEAQLIQASPVYRFLSEGVEMEMDVNLLGKLLSHNNDKYHVVNLCFADAIKDTNLDDGAWIWVHPDTVYADGSFSTIARVARAGKRIFLTPTALRAYTHAVLPILLSDFQLKDGSISIPARNLVKLSFDYTFAKWENLYWDQYNRMGPHGCVFWHVNNQGVLQRSYWTDPVMIYPEEKDEVPIYKGVSIEATDYLERAVPNPRDIYVVEDTDEFYKCSIETVSGSATRDSSRHPSVVEFALRAKYEIQGVYVRDYLRSRVRYRYCNPSEDDDKEWKEIEALSDQFVDSVFRAIERFDKYPLVELTARFFRRLEYMPFRVLKKFRRFLTRVGNRLRFIRDTLKRRF